MIAVTLYPQTHEEGLEGPFQPLLEKNTLPGHNISHCYCYPTSPSFLPTASPPVPLIFVVPPLARHAFSIFSPMGSFRFHVPRGLCVVCFLKSYLVDCTQTPASGPIARPVHQGPTWVPSSHTVIDDPVVLRDFPNYGSYRRFDIELLKTTKTRIIAPGVSPLNSMKGSGFESQVFQ